MKMFRNGYWQKLVLLLTILIEIALLIFFTVSIVADGMSTPGTSLTYFIILIVARAFICVFIVWTDSAAQYKIAWLVFVGALPIVGGACYLFFAHKLRTKKERRTLTRYYDALKHDPATDETKRKLLEAA